MSLRPQPAGLILRPAPETYSQDDQAALRDALRREDGKNLKRGRDIEVAGGMRLILTAPDGGQWAVEVDNGGNLSTSAV